MLEKVESFVTRTWWMLSFYMYLSLLRRCLCFSLSLFFFFFASLTQALLWALYFIITNQKSWNIIKLTISHVSTQGFNIDLATKKRKKHRLYHYSMHSTSILLVVPLIQELFPSLTENLIGVNFETRKLMGATWVWSMVGVDTNNWLWN